MPYDRGKVEESCPEGSRVEGSAVGRLCKASGESRPEGSRIEGGAVAYVSSHREQGRKDAIATLDVKDDIVALDVSSSVSFTTEEPHEQIDESVDVVADEPRLPPKPPPVTSKCASPTAEVFVSAERASLHPSPESAQSSTEVLVRPSPKPPPPATTQRLSPIAEVLVRPLPKPPPATSQRLSPTAEVFAPREVPDHQQQHSVCLLLLKCWYVHCRSHHQQHHSVCLLLLKCLRHVKYLTTSNNTASVSYC